MENHKVPVLVIEDAEQQSPVRETPVGDYIQVNKTNRTIFLILCGFVVAALVAVVGGLASRLGKGSSSTNVILPQIDNSLYS